MGTGQTTHLEFPNGFESCAETHHEVVAYMQDLLGEDRAGETPLHKLYENEGTGGLYLIGIAAANMFEEKNRGREWDGEFFEEVELFCGGFFIEGGGINAAV